jgi:hypothetical protein
MGRRAPSLAPLELTGADRRPLARVAADNGDEGLAQRARVVLLAADGVSNREIAEAMAMTETTVGRWRARFVAEGMVGLIDRRHAPVGPRGRLLAPLVVSDEQREVLLQWSRRPRQRRVWRCGPASCWPRRRACPTSRWLSGWAVTRRR